MIPKPSDRDFAAVEYQVARARGLFAPRDRAVLAAARKGLQTIVGAPQFRGRREVKFTGNEVGIVPLVGSGCLQLAETIMIFSPFLLGSVDEDVYLTALFIAGLNRAKWGDERGQRCILRTRDFLRLLGWRFREKDESRLLYSLAAIAASTIVYSDSTTRDSKVEHLLERLSLPATGDDEISFELGARSAGVFIDNGGVSEGKGRQYSRYRLGERRKLKGDVAKCLHSFLATAATWNEGRISLSKLVFGVWGDTVAEGSMSGQLRKRRASIRNALEQLSQILRWRIHYEGENVAIAKSV